MMRFSRAKMRLRTKYCQFEGCGKKYQGTAASKFCPEHRGMKRPRKKIVERRPVDLDNLVLDHDYREARTIVAECRLEGCNNRYEINVVPGQYVYPGYCEEHRNEYKREHFLNMNRS